MRFSTLRDKPSLMKKTAQKTKQRSKVKTKSRSIAQSRPSARKKSSIVSKAKKVVQQRLNDNRLLEIAAAQYSRLLKELNRRKLQLSDDKKTAFEIGERILAKAKQVSASLVKK